MRTFIESGYDLNRLIAIIFGNTENFFFNLELTFDIRCLLDENGLIEGVVNEAK